MRLVSLRRLPHQLLACRSTNRANCTTLGHTAAKGYEEFVVRRYGHGYGEAGRGRMALSGRSETYQVSGEVSSAKVYGPMLVVLVKRAHDRDECVSGGCFGCVVQRVSRQIWDNWSSMICRYCNARSRAVGHVSAICRPRVIMRSRAAPFRVNFAMVFAQACGLSGSA